MSTRIWQTADGRDKNKKYRLITLSQIFVTRQLIASFITAAKPIYYTRLYNVFSQREYCLTAKKKSKNGQAFRTSSGSQIRRTQKMFSSHELIRK